MPRALPWVVAGIACALAPAPASSQAAPAPFRTAGIELQLDLDYPQQRISGRAKLSIENASAAPAGDALVLQLGRLMRATGVVGADGTPLPFTQDVVAYPDWTLRQVNAVRVRLPAPIAARDSTSVTVRYEGHLVGATETGMLYVRDHLDPAFTILREEAFAFPVVGEPSLASMRATPRRDFAFALEISVPDTLTVATGGEPLGREAGGGRAIFRARSRRAVPFLNVAVAPYRRFESGGVTAYVLPADSARGPELLDAVARSLAWLGERFGPLARDPAFAIMEIPDGWGSQAHLDAGILIEASALRRVENRRALYHEISHLWNAQDAEVPSPRWNEGLASWLERRMAADLDGIDPDAAMAASASALCRRAATDAALRDTPLIRYGEAGMTGSSYGVGALFFRVLQGVVGADAFDRAYRSAYQSAKDGAIGVDDLERAFVRADARAAAVFADWVRTTAWHRHLCPAADLARVIGRY